MKLKNKLLSLIFFTLSVVLSLALLLIFAPRILEDQVKSQTAKLGLQGTQMEVSSVSHRRLELRNISLGNPDQPQIKIALLSAEYDPDGLRQQRIDKINISGLQVNARINEKGLIIQGIEELLEQKSISGSVSNEELFRLGKISEIRLHSSTLFLHAMGQTLRVPFEGVVKKNEKGNEHAINLHLYPWNEEIVLSGNLDLEKGKGELEISTSNLQLSSLGFFKDHFPMPSVSGAGDMNVMVALDSWKPGGVKFSVVARGLDVSKRNLTVMDKTSLALFVDGKEASIQGDMDFNTGNGEVRVLGKNFSFKTLGDSTGQYPLPDVSGAGDCDVLVNFESWKPGNTKFSLNVHQLDLAKKGFGAGKNATPDYFISNKEMAMQADLDFKTGNGEVQVVGKSFTFKTLENATDQSHLPDLFGIGNFKTILPLKNWRPDNAKVSLALSDFHVEEGRSGASGTATMDFWVSPELLIKDIRLSATIPKIFLDQAEIQPPLRVKLSGNNVYQLKFQASPLKILYPYPATVTGIWGKITKPFTNPGIKANFSFQLDDALLSRFLPDLKQVSPYNMKGSFQAGFKKESLRWNAQLTGSQTVSLSLKDVDTKLDKLGLKITLQGNEKRATGKAEVSAKNVALNKKEWNVNIAAASFHSQIDFSFQKNMKMGGKLEISSANFVGPSGLKAEGLNATLPFHFPPSEKTKKGNFSIQKATFSGRNFHKIEGDMGQRNTSGGKGVVQPMAWPPQSVELDFSGEVPVPLTFSTYGLSKQPDVKLQFSGRGGIDKTGPLVDLDFKIPHVKLSQGVRLDELHPALKGLSFTGEMASMGNIKYAYHGLKGHGFVDLKNGVFNLDEPNISITGVHTRIEFKDLLNLVTAPNQKLQFKKLSWGEIPITNGLLNFQIEGPESFFLEKSEFTWCDGKIYSQAVRFNPEKWDFDLMLYCDRVKLARMLDLMVSHVGTAGEGEISGVIPLKIRGGDPIFQDAFLYSSPGSIGTIKIKGAQAIAGGNLLVEEAIKDFSYDWVKVELNSRGKNLDMVVNLNGVPNKKLRLVIDPKTKSFKRDEKGEGKVNLQGLHLKLKFNDLPLSELLRKRKLFSGDTKIQ